MPTILCSVLNSSFGDRNECNDSVHNCDTQATCTNIIGGFICACDAGYTGVGKACTGKIICANGLFYAVNRINMIDA